MRTGLLRAAAPLLLVGTTVLSAGACAHAPPPPVASIDAMRVASAAGDGESVGRWLLGELLAPGGSPTQVIAARKRLDALPAAAQKGLYASLGRAVDDESHGRFKSAALAHLDAVAAARTSDQPDAPLVGWYSAHHLLGLRSSVANLWEQGRGVVTQAIESPGNLGWRARSELVEWWSADGFRDTLSAAGKDAKSTSDAAKGGSAEAKSVANDKPSADATTGAAAPAVPAKDAAEAKDTKDAKDAANAKPKRAVDMYATRDLTPPSGLLAEGAKRYGCVEKARMAGPFGHGAPADSRVHFEAERAGPWPSVFPRDPLRMEAPRTRGVERVGCGFKGIGSGGGIYYVETFLDLPADREIILSVQAALAVFVDDTEVLTRDTRVFGIWPRFGAHLRLEAGRHRVVARVAGGESSVRVLHVDGTPLDVVSSDDPTPPYSITKPIVLSDPNVIEPFLEAIGVPPQKGAPPALGTRDTSDPVSRMLAGYLAHVEGQDDASAVLVEPLVSEPEKATGPMLAMSALFIEKDQIFPESDARDLVKDIRARASTKDPELWWPRFWLALDEADKGMAEVAPKLVELADHFREVPDILKALSTIYGKLGWKVEQQKAVRDTAARFPDDVDALSSLVDLLEETGDVAQSDVVAARIRAIDPDAEIDFQRALARRDYKAAIAELGRLGSIRKDRRDITARIADLLARAGQSKESLAKLEAALQKNPQDPEARLAVADARFAAGDRDALRKALVDAIQSGSDAGSLREAIELVDGMTELSPYRIDGKKIIAQYEASGSTLPGTAARVLDYSAIWIHPDGSARMLEHEIIGIQSREAIAEHAEQHPRGLLLKLRTVKKDGRILEPEIVEGKPTVTMPHLEVGDYIETETVTTLRGDGQGGMRFEGPRWFFREAKIPYWRSEFIVVSPKNRPLDIETGGGVSPPSLTASGALVIRKWRVDLSPALPEEPASAPAEEFLPNVRIGWGLSLKDSMARLVDAGSDETPRDPRLARVAEAIVAGASAAPTPAAKPGEKVEPVKVVAPAAPLTIDERARRIYRWVLANIEAGRETDARRIINGKTGNRTEAFLYLCRLSGIEAELGMVHDRLTPASTGPMSEAESFSSMAVRLGTEKGPRWMVVRDKFAPYGYMPSSLRGQQAVVLKKGAPEETIPTNGSLDSVTHDGVVELAADGSATITLEQRYEGKLAIVLRSALETLPDARLKETVESRLLPQSLPGARLLSVEVKNLADLDAPLVLSMKIEMSTFARSNGSELLISPPFPINLANLAALPSRETPLYISEQIATRIAMRLTIKLPPGATTSTAPDAFSAEDGGRIAQVKDRVQPGVVLFERVVDLPAGRVQPDAYGKFQDFARKVDAALHRDIVVRLGR